MKRFNITFWPRCATSGLEDVESSEGSTHLDLPGFQWI